MVIKIEGLESSAGILEVLQTLEGILEVRGDRRSETVLWLFPVGLLSFGVLTFKPFD